MDDYYQDQYLFGLAVNRGLSETDADALVASTTHTMEGNQMNATITQDTKETIELAPAPAEVDECGTRHQWVEGLADKVYEELFPARTDEPFRTDKVAEIRDWLFESDLVTGSAPELKTLVEEWADMDAEDVFGIHDTLD